MIGLGFEIRQGIGWRNYMYGIRKGTNQFRQHRLSEVSFFCNTENLRKVG